MVTTKAQAKPRARKPKQTAAVKRILSQPKQPLMVCQWCLTRYDKREEFAEHLRIISNGTYTIDDWDADE